MTYLKLADEPALYLEYLGDVLGFEGFRLDICCDPSNLIPCFHQICVISVLCNVFFGGLGSVKQAGKQTRRNKEVPESVCFTSSLSRRT